MPILVIGGSGFIGSHVATALAVQGWLVRTPSRAELDLTLPATTRAWDDRLDGIEVVVNAAGVFADSDAELESVHASGPIALFEACARRAVPVVQISALGADETAPTRFLRTKLKADDALLALEVPSLVLQPSLVFGPGGRSATLFTTLATLPFIPLPGDGTQRIQPVHIDDLAIAIVGVIREHRFARVRVAAVGPAPIALRSYLATLRSGLGLGRARFVRIPHSLLRLAAGLRLGLLDRDALTMLDNGSTADPSAFATLLDRMPRAPIRFIDADRRHALRVVAQLGWLAPLLRITLASVWVAAGVVSVGLYPVEESLALLERTGLTGAVATLALYGAAALDIVLGLGTLLLPRRRRQALWLVQVAVIVAYTAVITIFLPEQWLHPYGPVVKNLPLLAAIVLLREVEKR